jgi:hypothetical protein
MFRVMLCIIMAVAAAQAWDVLWPVSDPAAVGTGSAITYGNGKVWGIFPDPSDSEWTYFEYYDPNDPYWVYPGQDFDLDFLGNPAITFQWRFGGEVLVVGNDYGDPDSPMLYCYELSDPGWDEEEIDDFSSLGAGASIAFRPASGFYGTYVAGWMYCLVGGGQEFWRYSVPGPGDVAVDGICPGQGAVIADKTPWFDWPGSTSYYQLQVATSQSFATKVIDVYVSPSEYLTTTALANHIYFWRTRDLNGTGTWSAVHSFTLEGGWTQLANVPVSVTYGASLAYERDFYNDEECLIAFTAAHQYLDIYSVAGNSWNSDITTPYGQSVGSAIVTHEAASSTPPYMPGPWAMLGEYCDTLFYHTNDRPGWERRGVLPQSLGPGASLAYSIESDIPYLYLIVGQDGNGDPRNDFYRLELPTSGGGGQAGSKRSASLPARSLCGSKGITVEYQLSAPARVRASVFDAVGSRVGVLNAGEQQPGTHRLSWSRDGEGRKLSAGTYFVLLDMGTEQARLKAVVK